MIKNLILLIIISIGLVACGGGGSGSGAGASCDQVNQADQILNANNCEEIFGLLVSEDFSSINVESAELCYKNAKIIQSAAGKTCTDPDTGEESQLISASEFAQFMKPVDEAMVALRRYNGTTP